MILFKNLNKRISVRRKYMCLSKEDLVELMEILPHLTSTAVTEKVLSVRKIYYNKRLWLNRQLSFEHWCLFYLTFYALLYEIMSLDFYINKVRILFIFLLKSGLRHCLQSHIHPIRFVSDKAHCNGATPLCSSSDLP